MIQLRLGDCLEILPTLGKIDAVVSDPPYGMKWDTGCKRFSGGSKLRAPHHSRGKEWGAPVVGDNTPFDPSPWLGFPKVILWGSNHFAGRLPVGTTLVWVKRNESAYGTFLSDAELAWMNSGHGVYLNKPVNVSGNRRYHPTQKPVALMRWCIERLKLKPGSTILDPYMGSGSTGVAAVELGFNFVGIEIDPGHFETARRRIEAATHATPMFNDNTAADAMAPDPQASPNGDGKGPTPKGGTP